jgi:hypothetical protein
LPIQLLTFHTVGIEEMQMELGWWFALHFVPCCFVWLRLEFVFELFVDVVD